MENSEFARFNLWSKNKNSKRVENPKLTKAKLVIFGLVFSLVIKLRATHTRTTNPSAPRAVSQPSRMIKVKKLNRPKRNIKLPGNLISNNR
jgi:hypothetical protein